MTTNSTPRRRRLGGKLASVVWLSFVAVNVLAALGVISWR